MKTPKGEINDQVLEIVKDEAMITQMKEAKTPEDCYAIVKEKISISFEEFKSSMAIANEYLTEKEEGILTDDDLEQIAGGKGGGYDSTKEIIDTAISGAGVIVAASAAAAV